ncbi:PaaX family transcriptional regulator [Pseudonocardia sp. KRD-184]|uniref:PaaX family transcriptional regulator n=2 Tax=Pseudonocardia oceani TaxID=2792013 RepID=A0ABS6U252_9PSEU|nr:PaaX family transcriptional regulator C-terminal domain-containing protein [Pseudonocardia oceani]MBW0095631.1 PaaX family transcriptional regulator [Pseudonocardia oceani]MBW0107853.1 PaaX family transcriptional regulator [Pseudonocardia oceani]MBW0122232.1 PaaX family transcriptional regulator [Pseudonocardia oceani]MBW0126324.1 PaaX family transcriptional regulator [Pseudonocardia oceani]
MEARSGSAPAGGGWQGNGAPRASRSARSLLFTVVGEYLRDPGATLWTAGAVAALGRLGVEERAARQALTRTARDGWITAERHGRRTLWRLTSRAADHFRESAESVYRARRHPTDWDGTWTVLVTSVPESRRELRHRLRTRLRWAGFGPLGQGVWISPRVGSEKAARQVLDELGLTASAVSVVGRIGGLGSEFEVVSRAWDLGGLARDYAAFAAEFSDRRERDGREPAVVFAEQTRMVHRWREFALRDPVLPADLLPARWPGHDARDLFFRRHDADHHVAAAWLGALS